MPLVDDSEAALLLDVLHRADLLFVKKLSRNDRAWASDRSTTHQNGVYIPVAERDSGFFPELAKKHRKDPSAALIWTASFRTWWPQLETWGTAKSGTSNLTNWTSKGEETHLTCLPGAAFRELSPASYLVMGRTARDEGPVYECLTVDSATDDALLLMELLDIDAEFQSGLRSLADEEAKAQDNVLGFVDELLSAWSAGTIADFAQLQGSMPDTATLALLAREQYYRESGVNSLDPFVLEAPGNVLRHISRGIEWDLFREYQHRARAVALVRIVAGDEPGKVTVKDLLRALVDRTQKIDDLMLSASQRRKSRAGYSFEHHIERMLGDGDIAFEKQVIIEGRKRPDFVLPSLAWLDAPVAGKAGGLILSAKTTLRERWKQVQREMDRGEMFLATVDENIAGNAIEDMATLGISLVVPETLKASKDLDYRDHPNVLDFRTFFEDEVRRKRLGDWPTPAARLF